MEGLTHRGRVAVVTGAARGLGRAIACALAARGATVAAVDVRQAAPPAGGGDGGGWVALEADVSSEDDVRRLADEVHESCGPCSILVNNAGIPIARPFGETDYALWQRVLRVNLDSQFLMAKAFADDMLAAGWGRIVNVASSSLYTTTPGLTAYMASKGGVLGLTSALANDLGPHGVTVNAVSPGLTRTPGAEEDAAAAGLDPAVFETVVAQQAVKRPGTPEDLAGAVVYLTSDQAGFVTGQLLVADGGMVRPW